MYKENIYKVITVLYTTCTVKCVNTYIYIYTIN